MDAPGALVKIGVVSTLTGVPWGGSEELWAQAAEEALKQGHEVAVSFARQAGGKLPRRLEQLRAAGVRVSTRAFNSGRLQRQPSLYRAASTVLRPYRPLLAFEPDVVLFSLGITWDCAQFYDANDLPGRLRARGVPYTVVSELNDDTGAPPDSIRRRALDFLSRARRACFVSERNRSSVERQLAARLPNSLVVNNPVNLSDRSPVPWPTAAAGVATAPGAPGDEAAVVRLASVARLETRHKGQDVLFETLAAPPWPDRNWELRLYGVGPDENYLRALAELYGIARRVRFMGQVSDIRGVWAENHLLVMPSRGEGMPLALVEAMLCGRPAVATDVGGNAEWVKEGESGFVAEVALARSFGRALERAWQAQGDWPRMGGAAHETASARVESSPGLTLLRLMSDGAPAAPAVATPGRLNSTTA